jgi:hypothetical protein
MLEQRGIISDLCEICLGKKVSWLSISFVNGRVTSIDTTSEILKSDVRNKTFYSYLYNSFVKIYNSIFSDILSKLLDLRCLTISLEFPSFFEPR